MSTRHQKVHSGKINKSYVRLFRLVELLHWYLSFSITGWLCSNIIIINHNCCAFLLSLFGLNYLRKIGLLVPRQGSVVLQLHSIPLSLSLAEPGRLAQPYHCSWSPQAVREHCRSGQEAATGRWQGGGGG